MGLDGGRLASFVRIRPFCVVVGGRHLWVALVSAVSLVGLGCGRSSSGGGCLTSYGDGIVVG